MSIRLIASVVFALCVAGLGSLAQAAERIPPYMSLELLPGKIGADWAQSGVTLRVMAPDTYSGCVAVGKVPYTTAVDDDLLEITFEGYDLGADPAQMRGETCPTRFRTATVDVPLSFAELKEKGIRTLRLWQGPQVDRLGIEMNDQSFALTYLEAPRYFKPRVGISITGRDPLRVALLPPKALRLEVDPAPVGDVRELVRSVVEARGLTLLEYRDPELTSNAYPAPQRVFYVLDGKGQFAMQLGFADGLRLGRIEEPLPEGSAYRARSSHMTHTLTLRKSVY